MWYFILGLLIAIYISINLVLPGTVDGVLEAYLIRPLLWTTLAIVAFLIAKREGLNIWNFQKIRRWQIGNSPLHAALLIGGFQISLLVIAGLFVGFGKSPNLITIETFFIFLFYIASALFGIELTRAYFIKKGTQGRRNITLAIALIAIVYMFIQIRLIDFATLNLAEPVALIKFVGETIIPLLAMSLFASYLAYYGGAIPAIAYMGMLQAFEMYSPILPDLDWIIKALIGVIAPTIGFLLIQQSIQETRGHFKPKRLLKKRDPTLTWVGVALISLFLVFFSFGYFGVEPTVISSGSMRPALDTGDIVVLTEVPLEDIEEGDVIQYTMNNFSTIHRVHKVHALAEGAYPIMFTTKGDANDEPDFDSVMPEQVTGKAVFTIPKLGWIPIIIKSLVSKIGLTI